MGRHACWRREVSAVWRPYAEEDCRLEQVGGVGAVGGTDGAGVDVHVMRAGVGVVVRVLAGAGVVLAGGRVRVLAVDGVVLVLVLVDGVAAGCEREPEDQGQASHSGSFRASARAATV